MPRPKGPDGPMLKLERFQILMDGVGDFAINDEPCILELLLQWCYGILPEHTTQVPESNAPMILIRHGSRKHSNRELFGRRITMLLSPSGSAAASLDERVE